MATQDYKLQYTSPVVDELLGRVYKGIDKDGRPVVAQATAEAPGLMSAADKAKLDGLEKIAPPAALLTSLTGFAASATGGLDLSYTRAERQADGTYRASTGTTALPAATGEAPGLMSAADKAKLDGMSTGGSAFTPPSELVTFIQGLDELPDAMGRAVLKYNVYERDGNDEPYRASTVYTSLDNATAERPGMMAAADKQELARHEELLAGDKPLVAPVIRGTWRFFASDGTEVTLSGLDAKRPVVERGYMAAFSGTYSYPAADAEHKAPTAVGSGAPSAWAALPRPGVASQEWVSDQYAKSATVAITLTAPRRGLMVSGTAVVPATGVDSARDAWSVIFLSRRFFGAVGHGGAPSEEEMEALATDLSPGRSLTREGVSTGAAEYYCYAYPADLGLLATVIQDGATPVIGAFSRHMLTVVNAAGERLTYVAYVSLNPGAFSGVKLAFS